MRRPPKRMFKRPGREHDVIIAAEQEGWPVDVTRINRPPLMHLLLASGEEVGGIVVQDMTPTGAIDAAHFDERARSEILSLLPASERPLLSAAIQQPWLC